MAAAEVHKQGEILWRDTARPEDADEFYDGPDTRTEHIRAGQQKSPDLAAFQADTIWEKDASIAMRDGAKIRTDIFRPTNSDHLPVPALIAWSPYGKSGRGFFRLDLVPGRVGVPRSRLSGYEKFEAPDPAEWTARGYAIVNPDPRGSYDSEGNLFHAGSQEGQDGYDLTEAVARLPWCNGSVAFVGNSWLGIAQWFIAAQRPPHLKCIAPFEGAADMYRDILCRGGIPQTPFWDFLSSKLCGRQKQEDVVGMLQKYPDFTDYWQDKRAKVENINVPAYVLASYSTFLHTFGSFRGFEAIQNENKWLRVHPTQEWHDLYQQSTNDELQKFLDRYTKGIENGWEQTPKVRASILRYNKDPLTNIPFSTWPIPETKPKVLYLAENFKLATDPSSTSHVHSYQADAPAQQMDQDPEELRFTYTFPHTTTILGSTRATLYMSTPSQHSDMDIFVQIRKADSTGRILHHLNIPKHDLEATMGIKNTSDDKIDPVNPLIYLGPTGALRASYRAIDERLSSTYWPEHTYSHAEKLKDGEIMKLEIGLWQTGIQFEAGEMLVFKVSGHPMALAEFPPLRGAMPNYNKGRHRLHIGGESGSCILLPTVEI